MRVDLPYGRSGKTVEFPDDRTTIIRPQAVSPVDDEKQAIRRGLRDPTAGPPLRDRVEPDDCVVIVLSDITRPMPNDRVLPVLLDELECVPADQVTLINALGTHRRNTPDEIRELLGSEALNRYRVIQHQYRDEGELVHLRETSAGNEACVNRIYTESSVRILTQFIELALFAGFSRGAETVWLGLVGARNIAANHGPDMIGHPKSLLGETEGNPIREEPHRTGVALVRRNTMILVEEPYDVVVTPPASIRSTSVRVRM